MFKKALFSLFVLSFIIAPLALNAQSADDIAKLIAKLEQQIAYLKQQLAQLQGNQSGAFCYTFEKNLGVGSGGKDVDALHTILVKEGFSISPLPVSATTGTSYEIEFKKSKVTFTEATAAAVSAFQLKYKDEILTPLGLTNPTGYVGPSTRAVLNRLYGCKYVIQPPTPTPTPTPPFPISKPLLTVVSPNGGESWQKGTDQLIQWSWYSGTFIGQQFTIYLNPASQTCPDVFGLVCKQRRWEIAGGVSGTSYYKWNVGKTTTDTPPAGAYYVQICATTNYGGYACDQSDSYFKIYDEDQSGNKPPTISGVSGPTTLKISETGTWTVQASDPENGSLSYSVIWGDEPKTGSTAGSVTVQQTATFTHTYSRAGTYYPKFKVTDNASQSNSTSLSVVVGQKYGCYPQYVGGPVICVDPPPPQLLTVVSPNGGESWQKGSSYPIQWKTNATDVFIRISISNFSGNWYPVYSKTDNDGIEYWTIPSTIKSGTYWMSVSLCRSDNDCYWNDWSDSYFKISGDDQSSNQPPRIVSRSPWPSPVAVGDKVTLAWSAYDPDGDKLSLGMDWGDGTGAQGACLISPAPKQDFFGAQTLTDSHAWLSVGTYTVTATIYDCRGGAVKDSSKIQVGPLTSTLQVLSPNGGETWFTGSTRTISWGATGAPEVSVYLVKDSDPTYRLAIRHNFVSGRANSIEWTVTDDTATSAIAAGSDYRIWVIGGGATAVDDKSDAPFNIATP